MTIDKTLVLGFAAGVAAGIFGYKFYSENQDLIKAKLKESGLVPAASDSAAEEASGCTEPTLEELMTQKEHLEDLIAEYQARAAQ